MKFILKSMLPNCLCERSEAISYSYLNWNVGLPTCRSLPAEMNFILQAGEAVGRLRHYVSRYDFCVVFGNTLLKYFTVLYFLISTHTHAQDNVVIPESRISIYCNVQNAKIFLDTTLVGYTSLENYTVKPGFYVLRVLSPDERSWFSKSYIDSIQIQLNENFVKNIELEYIWFISSSPSGADVYYKDSLIGGTPTVFYSKSDINLITFDKPGYEKITIPADKNNSRIDVELRPEEQNILIHQNKYLSKDGNKLQGSVYVAAGGAVLFGATAVYTKIKADEYYKRYRKTGDASLLTKVRKLDTYSGISLAVTQVSSFLLTYLLLSK